MGNIIENGYGKKAYTAYTKACEKNQTKPRNIKIQGNINREEAASEKTDRFELSAEGLEAVSNETKIQNYGDKTAGILNESKNNEEISEKNGGRVAVNVSKRLRQIAAAQSGSQLQQVLTLLSVDLSDCKAGLKKGWCDEQEIAKVQALIRQANARMSEVSKKSEDSVSDDFAFEMASLM